MLTRLFTPKWYEVVIALSAIPSHEAYAERLFKKVDLAHSNVKVVLKLLEAAGFLRVRPRRNVKVLELTEAGETLAMQALAIQTLLRRQDGLH